MRITIPVKQGDLLVASPEMDDPYFKNSIILIAGLDNCAAAGFILNRPTTMPASELFDGLDDHYLNLRRRMFVGGPVEEDTIHLIAVGHQGKISTSPDGKEWTAIPYGTANAQSGFLVGEGINAVAYGNGRFVLAGNRYQPTTNSKIVYSD